MGLVDDVRETSARLDAQLTLSERETLQRAISRLAEVGEQRPGYITGKRLKELRAEIVARGVAAEKELSQWQDPRPIHNADDFAEKWITAVCQTYLQSAQRDDVTERAKRDVRLGESLKWLVAYKARATKSVWDRRVHLYQAFQASENRVAWLRSQKKMGLGPETVWNAAKLLGIDCCKPDRHLKRIALWHNSTPELLTQRLSAETGFTVAHVDSILYYASLNGRLIDTLGMERALSAEIEARFSGNAD